MKPALDKIRQLIPPLGSHLHKGQAGRIAILGGSEDYSGAPFYSAMAAMRLGADLTFVMCDARAANVIKGYSPDPIVLPYLHRTKESLAADVTSIKGLLDRVHTLVVGPGLSRDPALLERASAALSYARECQTPVVVDADALYLVQQQPHTIQGNTHAILTPNVNEFHRLCETMNIPEASEQDPFTRVRALSQALGGVTIVQKGASDLICNAKHAFTVDNPGGLKRCGGQGDVLTGLLATILSWTHQSSEGVWKKGGESPPEETAPYAAYLACLLARDTSQRAFKVHGRALQTSDILKYIGETLVAFEKGA